MNVKVKVHSRTGHGGLEQCFSPAGPRPCTEPWHQLYRAARGSPGICHFSFLSNFHEFMFYSRNIMRRKIFLNLSKNLRPRCWPEETTICYKISFVQWLITKICYKISLVQWLITKICYKISLVQWLITKICYKISLVQWLKLKYATRFH